MNHLSKKIFLISELINRFAADLDKFFSFLLELEAVSISNLLSRELSTSQQEGRGHASLPSVWKISLIKRIPNFLDMHTRYRSLSRIPKRIKCFLSAKLTINLIKWCNGSQYLGIEWWTLKRLQSYYDIAWFMFDFFILKAAENIVFSSFYKYYFSNIPLRITKKIKYSLYRDKSFGTSS